MPRRFERHARAKSDWGTPPARSAEIAAAAAADPEPVKRAPAPKDTRRMCKGKAGREHVPQIVIASNTSAWNRGDCEWGSRWTQDEVAWRCHHREVCSECGKVLREPDQLQPGECPDYPGSEQQRANAEQEAREWAAKPRPAWRRRIITGPQHYRRKRAS